MQVDKDHSDKRTKREEQEVEPEDVLVGQDPHKLIRCLKLFFPTLLIDPSFEALVHKPVEVEQVPRDQLSGHEFDESDSNHVFFTVEPGCIFCKV